MTAADSETGSEAKSEWVIIGRFSGLYGVRGWLKIFSYTQPREQMMQYNPWWVQRAGHWQPLEVEQGRTQGKGVVVKCAGIADRDSAAQLLGQDIAVRRDQFADLEPGEYYWTDLEGLRVLTLDGRELGQVDHLFDTGAHAVVVVRGERERLIPFVQGQVIRKIDLVAGTMEVDWDPDF